LGLVRGALFFVRVPFMHTPSFRTQTFFHNVMLAPCVLFVAWEVVTRAPWHPAGVLEALAWVTAVFVGVCVVCISAALAVFSVIGMAGTRLGTWAIDSKARLPNGLMIAWSGVVFFWFPWAAMRGYLAFLAIVFA
jgi:hypothetical protein